MAKNLGTFTFAANFQVKAAEALDPRMVAASKADLITKENWPHDGDTIYVYKGLIVDCGTDGVYRLIDPAKALATDYSGWERIDAGGVQIDNIFVYKGSIATYETLPIVNATGDVYNVEAPFVLGEGESAKTYPAGTNVAWNGTSWDPLAGSVDLSNYSTKGEVAEVRATASANSGSISELSTALGLTNAEVAKKVDAVEGYSLISAEKLALIDTNAGAISTLTQADVDFDTRLKTIEGAFTGEGGTIDLGDITTQLGDHSSRIGTLESDNTTNKAAIGTLLTFKETAEGQISSILELNTQQTGQITGLTEDLGKANKTIESHTSQLVTLNTAVGANTTAVQEIRNSIDGLAVKSVKSGDLVLAADAQGVLSTTINLNSYKDETDGKTYVALTGIEGALISRFDASAFVKDGMIDSVVYDTTTKNMTITWNTDSGKQPTVIPMSGLVDTYTAGAGLTVAENKFSVVLSQNTNNKLTLAEDGLMVDISADVAAINSSVDEKISNAFAWVDVTSNQ